jgi:hypothetical protein
MYGRETLVGHQKSIFTGGVRPACFRSAIDFAGSYLYSGTPFLAKPTSEGGRNCVAGVPTPP